LCRRALDGDRAVLDELEHEFQLLAASGDLARDPSPLEQALEPWLVSAHDAGMAGLAACAALRRLPDELSELEVSVLRAAVARTEMRYHDVLRTVIPPFVHGVLALAGADSRPPAARRSVLLVTGANPAPGDRELAERLHARGIAVEVGSSAPSPDRLPDVLIVTSRVSDAVALELRDVPVPIVAWGRGVALGLATGAGVVEEQLTVEVVAPGDPLAADLSGTVRVHRAPGKLSWVTPGDSARVVARLSDGRPAIAAYEAGAVLPDGRRTAAPRVMTFFAGEGAAPWLVSPEGHALVIAAIEHLAAWGEEHPERVPAWTGATPIAGPATDAIPLPSA
jgi:hypothetical protein